MEKKKKIVIIGPAFPLRGGIASFNERLAKELNLNDYEVVIYSFSLQYPSFLFPGTTQFSTGNPPENIDIRILINSINPINWISIGLNLKKIKPDLILVRYWLPFMGPSLGTILRIAKSNHFSKIICIADNIIPHEKRIGDNIFTKYFIKPIDAFVTMSEKVLNDLMSLGNKKPAIQIPHPLYDNFGSSVSKVEARSHLKLPTDSKIMLFFGFIRKYKGLDLLFEAMADKRIKDLGIKLLVAGEFYQDSKPYLEMIDKLGIKDSVILHTSFISDDEVKYYCCASDVIVQPYRNATQSGITPLAYHFDKPMIVTNVGGLAKMVLDRETGLIAEPNADSITEHIIEYFNLGEQHFLPNLQVQKNKLSWNSFSRSVLQLYDDLKK
jgi:glycosyltransferase involved in cell wall biosynthesis